MRINSFMKSSLRVVHLLIVLSFFLSSAEPLSSAENITAQEPLYRDPDVGQKELKEKLVIKDEYSAKYPGEVSNYTERGEIYTGLYKLSRDDKDLLKATQINPSNKDLHQFNELSLSFLF